MSITLTVSMGNTMVPAIAAEEPPRTTLSHRANGRAGFAAAVDEEAPCRYGKKNEEGREMHQ